MDASDNPSAPNGEAEHFVVARVASKTGLRADQIKTDARLLHDLGLYGDDAEELITEVAEEFSLPVSSFDFGRYFFPESFAFWMFPPFLRRRIAANKAPLTVEQLVISVQSGRWIK
ncbi:MAG: DUF1493 family protein [Bryobacterales bacterium]|nr:DUF1493 family protein [Bryobacterales bacterium]